MVESSPSRFSDLLTLKSCRRRISKFPALCQYCRLVSSSKIGCVLAVERSNLPAGCDIDLKGLPDIQESSPAGDNRESFQLPGANIAGSVEADLGMLLPSRNSEFRMWWESIINNLDLQLSKHVER